MYKLTRLLMAPIAAKHYNSIDVPGINGLYYLFSLLNQIDIEMSFIDEEGIMGLIEQLLMHVLSAAGVDKKPVIPFPRMTYSSALSQVCRTQ